MTGAASFTSVTDSVTVCVSVLVPSETCTVKLWLAAASRSRVCPATSVTTPVAASISKRPLSSSVRL